MTFGSSKKSLPLASMVVLAWVCSCGSDPSIDIGESETGGTASFTSTPSSGTAPLMVQFTDTSNNGPSSWTWSFGDGATSTTQNPSHVYSSAGAFTIQHTASGPRGTLTAETQTVTVSAAVTFNTGEPPDLAAAEPKLTWIPPSMNPDVTGCWKQVDVYGVQLASRPNAVGQRNSDGSERDMIDLDTAPDRSGDAAKMSCPNVVVTIKEVLHETLRIKNGTNVQIIGGEIDIDQPWPVHDGTYVQGGGSCSKESDCDTYDKIATEGKDYTCVSGACRVKVRFYDYNAGMYYLDDGRTGQLYVEGLDIHGRYVIEGIDFKAKSKVATFQNVVARSLKGGLLQSLLPHTDVIQFFSGYKTMRIDRLTGYTSFQGIMFNADSPVGRAYLHRVSFRKYLFDGLTDATGYDFAHYPPYGCGYNVPTAQQSSCAPIFDNPNFHAVDGAFLLNMVASTMNDTVRLSVNAPVYLEWGNSTGSLANAVAPHGSETSPTYTTWDALPNDANFKNWGGTTAGGVFGGVSPDGDYASPTANGNPGMGYVSPGYVTPYNK